MTRLAFNLRIDTLKGLVGSVPLQSGDVLIRAFPSQCALGSITDVAQRVEAEKHLMLGLQPKGNWTRRIGVVRVAVGVVHRTGNNQP